MFLSLLFIQNLSIFAPLIINLFTMKEWRCNWGVVEVSQVGPGRGRREERKEGERERERGRRVQVVSLFPITFLLLSFLLPVLSLFPFQKPESMQSTLVGGSAAGRLQGAKATLYVGGLSDNVNEAALHAAFIPFGEIKVCEEKSTPEKKKKKKNLGGSPSLFLRVCGVLPHGQSSRGSQERSASTPMGVDRVGRSEGLENERVFLALPPSSPLLSHSLSRPPPPLSWFLSPFSFSPPPRTTNQPIQTQKKKQDVSIPIDNATGSHRGFGFVEFEEEGDAAAAALNMDAAEFFGRTLRVNQSQSRIGGGSKRDAVWADGDAWNERQAEADNDGGGGGLLGASGAFKRQEVGGGGGAAAAAAREQPAAAAAASDPMAAAEAALG